MDDKLETLMNLPPTPPRRRWTPLPVSRLMFLHAHVVHQHGKIPDLNITYHRVRVLPVLQISLSFQHNPLSNFPTKQLNPPLPTSNLDMKPPPQTDSKLSPKTMTTPMTKPTQNRHHHNNTHHQLHFQVTLQPCPLSQTLEFNMPPPHPEINNDARPGECGPGVVKTGRLHETDQFWPI